MSLQNMRTTLNGCDDIPNLVRDLLVGGLLFNSLFFFGTATETALVSFNPRKQDLSYPSYAVVSLSP
ncbi:hypothetical protein CC78DRAFT_318955 [Lojkania enalia]|uniref:Uncharacterized protein n=1 Tax=Lojkania enalia TaxID=147567 RepID=A0A9P4K560_9PLEO|nr:hypothetical protein CC78DRAFT_318955 [Didymosphaeria enalia]